MAAPSSNYSPFTILLIKVVAVVLLLIPRSATGCYTSLISFGDSITDTGNYALSLGGKASNYVNLPYGETFFHHPAGRFSDGRVIVDFLAEALGLPFVPPSLCGGSGGGHCDFRSGVNFAVGGATALDSDFFRKKGLDVTTTNYSLGVQMGWFKQLLPSLCHSQSDCNKKLRKSLFLVGEIGGNDYNHPFYQGRSLAEIQTFVPLVIRTISSAITELIDLGARTLLVPGNFPIGCAAKYLTLFRSSSSEDYDPETGCIKWLNEFAEYHNNKLLEELDKIRLHHPHATVIYADYYNGALSMVRSPNPFGFGVAPLAACCGGGGPYNCNASAACGAVTARVCRNPSRYISWDGIHFTEAAYRMIADGLLNGSFTVPPINTICPSLGRGLNQAHQAI